MARRSIGGPEPVEIFLGNSGRAAASSGATAEPVWFVSGVASASNMSMVISGPTVYTPLPQMEALPVSVSVQSCKVRGSMPIYIPDCISWFPGPGKRPRRGSKVGLSTDWKDHKLDFSG